jgi:hypothetical protein|tara:strand:- start:1553 stop:1759 length:207 start_codon:yes stop_codon:yes gene_type:complete
MFLKLTLHTTKKKTLVNINNISSIDHSCDGACITMSTLDIQEGGECFFTVTENFDQIESILRQKGYHL